MINHGNWREIEVSCGEAGQTGRKPELINKQAVARFYESSIQLDTRQVRATSHRGCSPAILIHLLRNTQRPDD